MILKYDFAPDQSRRVLVPLEESLKGLERVYADFDAVILTSKDPFLSEYVPLENNPRFGATRFTGSVGDAIYFTAKFRKAHPGAKAVALFVDGRYHLQADQETNPEFVEVVKLDVEPNIEAGVLKTLSGFQGLKVGIDFERTSASGLLRYEEMIRSKGGTLVHLDGTRTLQVLGLPGWKVNRPLFSVEEKHSGRTLAKNFRALTLAMRERSEKGETLHVTATTDDAAFLLNARAYHLPHTASMLAYTFLVKNEVVVYLPAASKDCEIRLDPKQAGEFHLHVVRDSVPELKRILGTHRVSRIFYNGSAMNGLLPSLLSELFPEAETDANFKWVLETRTRKTVEEMISIRTAFIRSSRAIAKTLRFAKSEAPKRRLTEVELADTLYRNYGEEGAVALSFKTISGAGPNSAIVHYSTPSREHAFTSGSIGLLDSGAYYEEGYCTDCTRGFFSGGGKSGVRPEPWQKEIYTAALKAGISVFLGPVDPALSGKQVDELVRSKVREAGYDYLHGTGHGIGIHVHEEGIRFSTLSVYPQSPYACVSVEPGIYLKDKGGVRIENVVFLIPGPDGAYRFENLVHVGYDWDLVDLDRLTEQEKTHLKAYEARCRELGTELMECPL
jgi:Xaa-Pro aminopeptidase